MSTTRSASGNVASLQARDQAVRARLRRNAGVEFGRGDASAAHVERGTRVAFTGQDLQQACADVQRIVEPDQRSLKNTWPLISPASAAGFLHELGLDEVMPVFHRSGLPPWRSIQGPRLRVHLTS